MYMVNWELLTQSENSFLDISRGKRVRLNKQFNNRALQTSYRHSFSQGGERNFNSSPRQQWKTMPVDLTVHFLMLKGAGTENCWLHLLCQDFHLGIL